MKKLATTLILSVVLFAGIGLLASAGSAFAQVSHGTWEGADSYDDGGVSVPPVGQHLLDVNHPAGDKDGDGDVDGLPGAFDDSPATDGLLPSNAPSAIARNPNCPLYWQ